MVKRILTISSLSANNRREFPFIRLQGKWLEKLGFEIGRKVEVEENHGKLILTLITSKEG